jgi:glyoxylate reductase
MRVLLTGEIPAEAFQALRAKHRVTWNRDPLSERQLVRKVGPYHALLTTLADPVSRKVIQAAPSLQCISNFAVGFNNIDLQAARSRGIWVTHTPGVLTEATADIAWALLLSCARRLPEGEKGIRTGAFKGWHPLMLLGLDLTGKTLGIFGFGRIGKAVARRGRGWGMKVLYHQRHREALSAEREYNARFVGFAELLAESDFISVNAPLTPETRHRFARKEFRKMKRTCVFINTARGPLHCEKDLATALQRGWIHSAGLDVYEREPQVDPALKRLPNCTLLPHLGSATVETRRAMALLAAENIDRALCGLRPRTPVFELPQSLKA